MVSADTVSRYGGQSAKVNEQEKQILLALEKIMGWAPYSTTILQGCESTSVGASGGTHAKKQSKDLTPNEETHKEKFLRILGDMQYIRPAIKGVWSRHNHGGVDYTTNGGAAFNQQLAAYHRRRNALADNGPDRGYQMVVFPKNIFGGYIGYIECVTPCHKYEQQTTKSKQGPAVVKTQIDYVVAETEVLGKRWYVTLKGYCVYAANFKKIAKPAGATPTNPDVRPKPPVAPTSAPKPDPVPTPPPAPSTPVVGDSVPLNAGTRNVIMRRYTPSGKNPPFTDVQKGKNYSPDRVKLLASDVASAKLDILGTQEAGTYEAGHQLCAAIEAKKKEDWTDILHGDNAGDICQGILWKNSTLTMIEEGKIHTEGTSHDWLVWGHYTNSAGVHIYYGVLHCEWHHGGTSKAGNKYDKIRERQLTISITELEKKAAKDGHKDAVIIICGDLNSTQQNAYDGPGKAAAKLGYVDCENVAVKQVNTQYNSYHGNGNPEADKQFDRFLVKKSQVDSGKIKVKVYAVDAIAATKAGSDHYQTHVELDIRTK